MSSTGGNPAREVLVLGQSSAPETLAEEALRQSEELFRRTFEHANVGVAHVSASGRFIRVNAYLCRLLGRTPDELIAITFQDLTHPADLDADLGQLGRLVDGHIDSYTMEKRYIRGDGTLIWCELHVSLIRRPDGGVQNFISVITDIHKRREAQDQLELVLGEANHRIKNLIAVIGAIVKTSARGATSARELEQVVSSRLIGIAASHDLLMGKYETGARLDRLIRRQLDIFTDCSVERIVIAGEPVELNTNAVHAFGMVLHELATNACKYGSLSDGSGMVRVGWHVDEDAGQLRFSWVEEGGPPVSPPLHQGFGSKMLDRMLGGALRGTARLTLPVEGARFEAVLPLDAVLGPVRPA